MTISLLSGVYMCAASCRTVTIAISSMEYTDCAPVELPSFMCMHSSGHSSGECCLSLHSSDCGPMIMLAPAAILSGLAGPLSARKDVVVCMAAFLI